MTILTLNKEQLEKRIGKLTKEIEEKITMFGTPVEKATEKEIEIEVFPNRPDLLSLQGFARSFLQYSRKGKIAKFKTNKPEKNYQVKIEKPVKSVRPYTACAIIRNLKLDDEKIKEIIDIQEKLHLTIGRKRKKIAIGIYPLEKIKLPITFTAKKPEEIKFIPLESDKEMNGKQILKQHITGRKYAHLLEDKKLFPVFLDADNKILSMPPIINSQETGKITEKTKEVFIECSGFNLPYLKKCLNIITTTLYDLGGEIYEMKIEDSKDFISPDLTPEKIEFKIQDINKTLGLELSEKEIKKCLEKMGIECEKQKNSLIALIPPYRVDILHWIDLTEEVAIAYGYDNFKPEIPNLFTIAEENPKERIKKTIADVLSGLGLLEVSSFHLATKSDVKKLNHEIKNEDFIELEDSKTEYNTLRIDLLTNLLKIFSENSDSSYPQKIFELGKVFQKNKTDKGETKTREETGIIEKENLAIAIANEKVNFTELKQILDYLFKMLDKEYKLEEVENLAFISGRAGKIIVKDKNSKEHEIGAIGEVSPKVLKNFKLKLPVSAFEISLDWLSQLAQFCDKVVEVK